MLSSSRIYSLLSLIAVCVFVGCGGGDGGYRVSGKVTFNGQPVPAGKIYFLPDGSKGNTGASGFADIKDGQYDTSLQGGHGAPAGPVTLALEGIDPNAPPDPKAGGEDVTTKLLFARYEVAAEIPKSASTKDIDVPAEAAKGPVAPKGQQTVVP